MRLVCSLNVARITLAGWTLILVILVAPCITHAQQPAAINLVDVSEACGIGFRHSDGASGRRYIVETVTAGMAIFDYDNDGYQDVLLLSGQPLPNSETSASQATGSQASDAVESKAQSIGMPSANRSHRNALYRNCGNWTFEDVTLSAGLAAPGYGLGVVAGDYDDDGDWDLYVSNFGPSVFYRNNGDGTFTDVTAISGLENDNFAAGGVMTDIDADGLLDLYLANYVQFSFDKHITRMIGKHQFHPGPHDYPPAADRMFKNMGNGQFEDISQAAGIQQHTAPGMGVIAGDFDEDGDSDIFVANDSYPNFLWVNDGHGHFTEEATLAGLAVDRTGRENGNMGVECADFNGDLLMDLFSTTYQDEMPVLYLNQGAGFFQDATNVARIDNSLHPHVNWGVGAVDFDRDGDRDLFLACGHFMDNIRFIDDRTDVKVTNYLLLNQAGKFTNFTRHAGTGMLVVESSRGAAFDDLDNDGDVDVVVLNVNAKPTVIRNETETENRWLKVRLIGLRSNRWGIGAKVIVKSGGQSQAALVHAGRGYQSHYGTELHFGVGAAQAVESVEIRWPSGRSQTLTEIVLNETLIAREPAD